jgi:hypothetical protein
MKRITFNVDHISSGTKYKKGQTYDIENDGRAALWVRSRVARFAGEGEVPAPTAPAAAVPNDDKARPATAATTIAPSPVVTQPEVKPAAAEVPGISETTPTTAGESPAA